MFIFEDMFTKTKEPMVNKSNHVQAGIVYQTNDLDKFVTLNGNRVVNPSHVSRLADSIIVNGMLMNPIIVNSLWEVIDGQHRLEAAKATDSGIYYIVAPDYALTEVHTLNLNQKNWNTSDYLDGYADMGMSQYVRLKEFMKVNDEFSIAIAISICSKKNDANGGAYARDFNKGVWEPRSWSISQDYCDRLRLVGTFYEGFKRRSFVASMISLFNNPAFDFNEFMHKLRIQPQALIDCVTVTQYKVLIEDIYNYRRREKISLKY